ncbi:hypothetical protein FisN_5Hh512 [Fistulifera solaris]|uniref:Arf-GAP domain-containing protein n=1 Tax=Fistulifera solaris TaxID=1519565 RepID=A0A1Z5JTC0_FISSO|nr:hypothetical protein FisN_5Hh512 [Fistulifera solaris]|eukprot:GAX17126.1 hypothetical protein FisN_5Hh512 [Fistulifera solaris]
MASAELEAKRCLSERLSSYPSFPPACLALLKSIEGNDRCIDCGGRDPQWAAVSFGALVCLQCSGHHRSLGVQVSKVRSIEMDEWNLDEVIAMLEGGNEQLSTFFVRHALTVEDCVVKKNKAINKENVIRLRYKTKAAQFYRQQMQLHATSVLESGPYRGREMARRKKRPSATRRNSE